MLLLSLLTGCAIFGEGQTLVIYVPASTTGRQPTLREAAVLAEVPPDCMIRVHTTQGWIIQPDVPLPQRTGLLLPVGGRVPRGWGSGPYQGPSQTCSTPEWEAWNRIQQAAGRTAGSRLSETLEVLRPLQETDPVFLHLPAPARNSVRLMLGGGMLIIWLYTLSTFFTILVPRVSSDKRQYNEAVSDPGPFFGSVLWMIGMFVSPGASMALSGLGHFVATRRTSFGGSGVLLYTVILIVLIFAALTTTIFASRSPAIAALLTRSFAIFINQGDRLYLMAYLWTILAALTSLLDRYTDYSGNAALCALAAAICILWGWVPFVPPSFPPITPFSGFLIWGGLSALIFSFEAAERQAHITWRKDPILLAATVAILTFGVAVEYGREAIGLGGFGIGGGR
jgi:hypothetical protein